MMAFVMKSHIVVQGRVNASRSQAIGNGPETEHPEGRAYGKTEERRCRHPHADGSDFPVPSFLVSRSLWRLEMIVPKAMIMEMIPA